jgi:hypothetical protein
MGDGQIFFADESQSQLFLIINPSAISHHP